MSTQGQFHINYRFLFADGNEVRFDLNFDSQRLTLIREREQPPPAWTRLDNQRCPNCPLAPEQTTHCPAALSLVPLMNSFEHLLSHDHVFLEVDTVERTISRQTTIQRAVSSLMGLLLATSDCPHTRFFKPMARFHLPLASEEETVYRAAASYMLNQYFRKKRGQQPDFDLSGLQLIYHHIQEVNQAMAQRLRQASSADSPVNAIILLDLYAKAMPYAIDQALAELAHLFAGE